MAITASVRLLDVPYHLDRPFTYLLPAGDVSAQFADTVRSEYARRTSLEAQIYTVSAGDGARELTGEEEA